MYKLPMFWAACPVIYTSPIQMNGDHAQHLCISSVCFRRLCTENQWIVLFVFHLHWSGQLNLETAWGARHRTHWAFLKLFWRPSWIPAFISLPQFILHFGWIRILGFTKAFGVEGTSLPIPNRDFQWKESYQHYQVVNTIKDPNIHTSVNQPANQPTIHQSNHHAAIKIG